MRVSGMVTWLSGGPGRLSALVRASSIQSQARLPASLLFSLVNNQINKSINESTSTELKYEDVKVSHMEVQYSTVVIFI